MAIIKKLPWRFGNSLKTDAQNLRLTNGPFTTISSYFFANYINIFHKTEVQTVILRCWMGLNLNWFKSYDTKCKYIFSDLANLRNVNGHFSTNSSQFSAIYFTKLRFRRSFWGAERVWTSIGSKVMIQNVNEYWIYCLLLLEYVHT